MEQEVLSFLIAPFVMCLILVGIHCYLGLHVLARGVIFVDLSLAQVAAFGSTVALLLDYEHGTLPSYLISLGFTFLAAGLFALARKYEKYFPQEAMIGMTYALASAAVVLVVDHMAHGAEHIKESLVGQILWVQWPEILKTGAIYSIVGLIHFTFRKHLLQSSFSKDRPPHYLWDFLFYALFGVVITSSVGIAGVLVVFAFLMVPAVLSTLFSKSIRRRLIFGWALGSVTSLAGLLLSFTWNLPAGAMIVVVATALPFLVLGLFHLRKIFG